MRLLYDVALGLWGSIRETWPADEREGGVFLAGMAYAFVIFWGLVILVTILYAKAAGVRL